MAPRDINYNREDYVEIISGSKVRRKQYYKSDSSGNLAEVKTGRYCIISKEAVLRPPDKNFSNEVAFFPSQLAIIYMLVKNLQLLQL
ncbi:hypothetical protein JTB14_001122 [Gonioctena quinquepunctata]|nr:hypothetical protein JTB14_001122 [Gonioctena quinquepunctata]